MSQLLHAPLHVPTRVLLVGDGPGNAVHFRRLGGSPIPGFDLYHVAALEDARGLLGRGRYDAILLDLSTSEPDAVETLLELRGASAGVPIVVLTGHDDEVLERRLLRAGAQDCLVEGEIDAGRLARAVVHAMERQRLIVELELSARQASAVATHDGLTGLPNRLLFLDHLARAIGRATRAGGRVAVLFIDLDRFKSVNDRLGHSAGDRLLQCVARRLVTAIRAGDQAARIGGDEFVLLLGELSEPRDAACASRKILDRLREPFLVDRNELTVSASIGIALFPDDAGEIEGLLRRADRAMYAAKADGRDRYRFFAAAAAAAG